jgi:hypothetical protein
MTNVLPIDNRSAEAMANRFNGSDHIDTLDRAIVYQMANRVWRKYFNPTEISVLYYIIDRTIGWGKTSFSASVKNILTGNEDYAGVGVSRATLFRILHVLEMKGVIGRITKATHIVINLNVNWLQQLERKMTLPIPKRLQGTAKKPDTSLTMRPHQSHNETQNKRSNYKGSLLAGYGATRHNTDADDDKGAKAQTKDATASLAKTISNIQTAQRNTTSDRISSIMEKIRPSTVDVEALWVNTMIEHHPKVMHRAWTRVLQARLKREVKGFMLQGHTFGQYVAWVVQYWPQIIDRHFKWMKKSPAPTTPDIGFFLSFQDRFTQAFHSREVERMVNKGTHKTVEQLMAGGMTKDDALLTVAKRQVSASMADENRRVMEKVAQERRRAQRDLEQAKKLDAVADTLSQSGVKFTKGQDRRAGQVWGHTATICSEVQPVANGAVPDISITPDVSHDEAVEAMRQHMELAAAKVKDGEY